jgi:PilZ domain-containing protein
MEGRRERRLFVQCPVSIEGNQGVSEGMLINLSAGGGAIESEIPVQFGTILTLRVHLPSLNQPIQVDQAEVTWRAGDDFGVKFLQLGPQERERLNQVIDDLRRGILQQQAQPVRAC